MVRTIDSHEVETGSVVYAEYAGLSTDSKPTSFGQRSVFVNGQLVTITVGLATGSVFMEVNTGNVYMYDEAGQTWDKVGD